MREEHVWATLILAIMLVLLALIGRNYHITRDAMQHGYCEVTRVGSQGTVWAKCDDPR
jgi:uncharacterized iron-regulated membrane protein